MPPLQVAYTHELDGGGSVFYPYYMDLLRGLPRPQRVFEWCCGPAFIGFSLVLNGLCDSLCLADVNPVALDCCRRTVAHHGLADRVTIYQSDNLKDIPPHERWDLVVGNPPHFDSTERFMPDYHDRCYLDAGWQLHRGFYAAVEPFLAPNGMVLLLENSQGSRPSDFHEMIAAGGLEVVYCTPMSGYLFYFLGSVRRSEINSWAVTVPKKPAED